jgi:hypothetical protein
VKRRTTTVLAPLIGERMAYRRICAALALCGVLGAAPALAERCDGPPSAADRTAERVVPWRFCVDITKNADGEWILEGDRKTRDIEVPADHRADIIFQMDPDLHPNAWIAAVSIRKRGGGPPPAREFVSSVPPHDFGTDGGKIALPGRHLSYKVRDNNQLKQDYDYEVWIRTIDSDDDTPVDPGIRNGGRQN